MIIKMMIIIITIIIIMIIIMIIITIMIIINPETKTYQTGNWRGIICMMGRKNSLAGSVF